MFLITDDWVTGSGHDPVVPTILYSGGVGGGGRGGVITWYYSHLSRVCF